MRTERRATIQENELLRGEIKRLDEINRLAQQNPAKKINVNKCDASVQSNISINEQNKIESTKGDSCEDIRNQTKTVNNLTNDFQSRNNSVGSGRENLNINNEALIGGILRQFQALQVNIELPLFDPVRSNLIEFIKNFEKYCVRKNIDENQKLIIIEDSLKGISRLWFDTVTVAFRNFEDFKNQFLDKFFSLEARMKVKAEWENRKYRAQDKSFQAYYNEQIKLAKFSVPKMEPHEVNFIIINQLPQRVRDILSTIEYKDSLKIAQALARLDLSRDDAYDKGTNYQANNSKHNQTKNYHSYNNQQYDCGNLTRNNYQENRANENWRNRNDQSGYNNSTRNRFNESNPRIRDQEEFKSRNEFRDRQNDRNVGNGGSGLNSGNTQNNLRSIHCERDTNFLEALCWDIIPEKIDDYSRDESRIVSPQMKIQIARNEYKMLIDSGSDVTCIAEKLYNQLRGGRGQN